jgi:hypothetical protein
MERIDRTKDAANTLLRCTEVLPEGFRIDLTAEPERWNALSRALGSKALSVVCAKTLERAYERTFHEPFLFSAPCMAFEFRYHLNAYLCVKGFRKMRHVTTLILKPARIERTCRSIEIDRNDVYRWSQRLLFRYFFGIRKGYRRTARDPYAALRRGRYLRIPFYVPNTHSDSERSAV